MIESELFIIYWDVNSDGYLNMVYRKKNFWVVMEIIGV